MDAADDSAGDADPPSSRKPDRPSNAEVGRAFLTVVRGRKPLRM